MVLAWILDVVALVALAKHEFASSWHEARKIGQDPDDALNDRAGITCLALGQVLGLGARIGQVSLIIEFLGQFGCVLRIPAESLGAAACESVFREQARGRPAHILLLDTEGP